MTCCGPLLLRVSTMLTCRPYGIILGAAAVLLALARPSSATDWFVNNRDGDDAFDGRTLMPINEVTGPAKSIGAVLKRLSPGDTVQIANLGIVYHESLTMAGPRFNGVSIQGNGAVVSGAKPVPLGAWLPQGNALWKFTPRRKAYYQLVAGGQAVPEFAVEKTDVKRPAVPAGQWAGWHGSIYLQLAPHAGQNPDLIGLEFAGEEAGLTLLGVNDVLIRGLELRHFRLDGVNAHDRCRNIVLDNVRLVENGRAGLAAGGTSRVTLIDSIVENNRIAQVLDTELAQTKIVTSEAPAPEPAP